MRLGKQDADEVITTCVRDAGLKSFRGLCCGAQIAEDVTWPKDLRNFLENVGRSLIAGARYGRSYDDLVSKDAHDCDGRAFGYGNVGALVVTPFSVPTATVTALWQPGMYNGQPWFPLTIRTNKLNNLVIG